MPSSNICWGIEIGSGSIKGLKLEAAGEGVRVLDFVNVPHKAVLSTPGIDQNDALRVGLGAFANQVDLGNASIAISVPGHSAFARFAKLPPVEPKKVPDIVKFEAVQQIPFPIEQVEWDYQTFKNDDSPDIEVGIFAITRERIMERLTLYEDVGITPDYVTLSPVAAYNALAYDLSFTEKTPGTIVLDIGTTSTDLIVAEAGRVWIRTFPIGGHHFTEALVNAFQLSYPKAEKLKREAESSKHARHIFQAMRPIFGDLAQDVQRSIGYYQSLHKDAKLERLIGLGSTFRLPGLRKYLRQQIQMDVFRLEQFKRLSLEGPRAGEFQAQTLQLATAYGLSLQGLGMAALEANLMPSNVIKTAMWQRKVKWFGIAAGVAVAAGAAMFVRPFIDNTAIADNPPSPEISNTINRANGLKSEAQEVLQAGVENTAVAEMLNLLENRAIVAHIVNDLGLILKAAQDKAPSKTDEPVFTVHAFKTAFSPPADPSAPDYVAPPPDSSGNVPPPRPKITVTLEISTNAAATQADAQKLAINTIDAWLRANAKRPDMPYEIVVGPNPSKVKSFAGAPTSTETASPTSVAQNIRSGIDQSAGAKGGGGGGRGRAGAAIGDEGGGRSQPSFDPSAYQQPGTPQAVDASEAAAAELVNKLAPMDTSPPAETSPRTSFTVVWENMINPPTPKTEGEPK
jgi:type IV pilus assembly protein PilM